MLNREEARVVIFERFQYVVEALAQVDTVPRV